MLLHVAVVAFLFITSVCFAGAVIWLGVPLLWGAAALFVLFIALLFLQLPVTRDARRVAIFGPAAFIEAATDAARLSSCSIVFSAPSSSHAGQVLLRFLVDARAHQPGTILIDLPTQATSLRMRLPRLVETEPALVLCGSDAGTGRSFLGQPVAVIATAPLGLGQHLAKRALDLAIAIPSLIVLAPLLLLVALAVRLESPGGALFGQARIGRLGRSFTMLKFRSMVAGTLSDGLATTRDDPRVTALGRWLRATSLDELPQLLNVAAGDMSIVGPRPHIPGHRVGTGVFAEVISDYAARHRVTPGITGLAQISGMRGGLENYDKARRNVMFDLFYIRKWSLWLDIHIISRTLLGGMAGRDVF